MPHPEETGSIKDYLRTLLAKPKRRVDVNDDEDMDEFEKAVPATPITGTN